MPGLRTWPAAVFRAGGEARGAARLQTAAASGGGCEGQPGGAVEWRDGLWEVHAGHGHGLCRSDPFGSGAATDLGRGPGGRTAVLSLSERLFCLRGASSAMGQCGLRSCGCDEPEASDLKEASAPRTLRLAILRHGGRADQANPKMWRPGALSLRFLWQIPSKRPLFETKCRAF